VRRQRSVTVLAHGAQAGIRPIGPRQRWYALTLFAGFSACNFADRMALAVIVDPLKRDLGLSDTQIGIASGFAFAALYALLGLPIARWADTGVRRNLMSLSIGVWAVAVAACSLVNSYAALLLVRVMVGVGDAGGTTPAYSLIADLYGPSKRATPIAIMTAGGALGASIGAAAVGWIAEHWGWRVAFQLLAVPGVLLALLIRMTLREPPRGASDETGGEVRVEHWRAALLGLAKTPSYRWMVLGGSLLAFFVYGFSIWLPAFMLRSHAMSLTEVGFYLGTIGGVGGVAATLGGGAVADALAHRDPRAPLWFAAASVAVAAPVLLAGLLAGSPFASVVLLVGGQSIASLATAPLLAQVTTVAAVSERALATALISACFSFIGLGASGLVIGSLSDFLAPVEGADSLGVALAWMAPTGMVAAACLLAATTSLHRDQATAIERSRKLPAPSPASP